MKALDGIMFVGQFDWTRVEELQICSTTVNQYCTTSAGKDSRFTVIRNSTRVGLWCLLSYK